METDHDHKSGTPEVEFIEKLKTVKISRRRLLVTAAGAAGVAALGSTLAACGGGAATTATPTGTEVPTGAATSTGTAAATSTGTAAATATATAAGAAARGEPAGKFIYLSSGNYLGTWNPYAHTLLTHIRMQYNCLESLTYLNSKQELDGLLAESWKYLDPQTLEVKLRQGVKFHNGKEMTAEDVKASLEMGSDPKNIWSFFIGVKVGVEIVDPYTVRIIPEKPNVTLPAGGLSCTPICPKEDVEDPTAWEKGLTGTGPFKWVAYKGEDTGVEMTANMEYRAGPPRLKDLVFRFVADPNTRLAALKSGAGSVMDRLEPEQIDVVKADSKLEALVMPGNENKSLWFRMVKEPMKSNQKLRQAIAYGIDRDSIIKNVMRGAAYPVEGFLYNGCTLYSPAANYPKYDPEKAKQLLAEAGYPNGEGLRELEYITSVGFYAKTKEYGEAIVQMMKDIGINFKLNPMESAAWIGIHEKHDVGDMTDGGFFSPAIDQETHMSTLYRSGGIYTGDDTPETDALFDAEAAEVDTEKRKEKLATLNEALVDRMPGVALLQSAITAGISKKVKGFVQYPNSVFPLWDVSVEG